MDCQPSGQAGGSRVVIHWRGCTLHSVCTRYAARHALKAYATQVVLGKRPQTGEKGWYVKPGCTLIVLVRLYTRSLEYKQSYLFTTGVGTLSTTVAARPSTAEPGKRQNCLIPQNLHQHAALKCCSRAALYFRL